VYHHAVTPSEEVASVKVIQTKRLGIGRLGGYLAVFGVGLLLAQVSDVGWALRAAPAKHRGVSVATLGVVDAQSMSRQLGIEGHIMQLREITLEAGGAIAKHGHGKRPGLVWTRSGSWVEGRANGEIEYPAGKGKGSTISEDAETDHWFFNDGSEPARVLVCDIVPAP
jgi:quercetin dioxygenase-like cupin family protein